MEIGEAEGGRATGCEPVVVDDERRRLLWLMTEYFRTLGFTDIRARLPGFVPPPVLTGTIEDHRPDFTCRQSDRRRTPIILEVVTHASAGEESAENRWSLLSSAARLYSAELHFVVPRYDSRSPVENVLRRRLQSLGLSFNRVWAV